MGQGDGDTQGEEGVEGGGAHLRRRHIRRPSRGSRVPLSAPN
jgi:hypothetical protein